MHSTLDFYLRTARKETNVTLLHGGGRPQRPHYVLPWSDSAKQTNYISKWWDIQEKLIKIITTSTFYNENDMHMFFWLFLFQPSAEHNWPNSWKRRCCYSTPYIFHGPYLLSVVHKYHICSLLNMNLSTYILKYNYILYTPQPMGPTKVTNCRGE